MRPGKDIDDRKVVAVNAVRVEVWRQLFDVETNLIRIERLKQAIAKVPAR